MKSKPQSKPKGFKGLSKIDKNSPTWMNPRQDYNKGAFSATMSKPKGMDWEKGRQIFEYWFGNVLSMPEQLCVDDYFHREEKERMKKALATQRKELIKEFEGIIKSPVYEMKEVEPKTLLEFANKVIQDIKDQQRNKLKSLPDKRK